jgi:CheY-like chemotaxis protein
VTLSRVDAASPLHCVDPDLEVTPVRARPVVPQQRRRILLVDDNVDAAETLAEVLCTLGLDVTVAHDALQALEITEQFTPEVALVDIGLPVMDGYELATRLKAQFGNALRLVAVTGYGQDQDRERSAAAGFHQHLTKPVQLANILDAIGGKMATQ